MRKKQNQTNAGIKVCLDALNKMESEMIYHNNDNNNKFIKVHQDIDFKNKEQDAKLEDHNSKIGSIFELLENQNYKITQIIKRLDDSELNIKNLKQLLEKIQSKMTSHEINSKERLEGMKNDLFESMAKAQNKFDKNIKFLNREFTTQKLENLNKIDESKEFTNQEISKNSEKIENIIEKFKNNQYHVFEKFNLSMNDRMSKLTDNIDKFKEESITNDNLFDTEIQKLDSRVENILNNILKPSYDLESKHKSLSNNLIDLEKKYSSSNNTIRDVIRKLIYTMETSMISGKAISLMQKETTSTNIQNLNNTF